MDYELSELETGRDDCLLGYLKNIVAKGSQERFDYICDYLRRILFEPEKPLGVCLVFVGNQGSGKGCFWEEFVCVFLIGSLYSLTTEGSGEKKINLDKINRILFELVLKDQQHTLPTSILQKNVMSLLFKLTGLHGIPLKKVAQDRETNNNNPKKMKYVLNDKSPQ